MTAPGRKEERRLSNRMLWLVIAIPALTVAGCLLTIYIALSNPDELVSDYSLRNDTGLEPRPDE
jgi:hypothetical protein